MRKGVDIKEDSLYVAHSKESAFKKSIQEGSAFSISDSLGPSFITPFALAIGANSFHIGILSSLSGLVSPIGQLFGSKTMERHSRKKIVLAGKMIQILLWLGIVALAILYWKNIVPLFVPYILIVFYALFSFIAGLNHPAFFSWIGDIVPEKERGKYFAKRNRVIGFVGLIAFLIAAIYLDYVKTKGYLILGFAAMFIVSALFRNVSRNLTKGIFNPRFRIGKGYYFSFLDFIKRYDNYGKFSLYQAVLYFSIMIASPFFAVYMIKDLGFSYALFTVISISPTVFYLLFTPFAGKFSDKYGNVKLLYIAAFSFPIVPLLWIFLENPLWLIIWPGFFSGLANAAFIIGTTNFTYDSVSIQKRGLCVAYTSLLIGIGVFFGSLAGGFLVQYVSSSFLEPILLVFLISAALRLLSSLIFLPQISEERVTENIQGLSINFMHPFKMINSDIVWFKNFIHEK